MGSLVGTLAAFVIHFSRRRTFYETQPLQEEPFCAPRYRGTETVLGIVAALAAKVRMLVTAIWLLVKG